MRNLWYSFYFLVLGIISFYTGEIVTFIMLGFILLSLNNINATLKKNHKENTEEN
ncbi:hypothetical protein [Bacillus solitudinis]|uniref:hypothetical protein n=1 Tax=Bacillus solitudinis TaxID=2014074 RepID=UPI0018E21E18|nr:hypothetical protein [Bacillus solitudinis]